MKLTESTLKELIREEIEAVEEQMDANSVMDSLNERLGKIELMLRAIIKFHNITDGVPK